MLVGIVSGGDFSASSVVTGFVVAAGVSTWSLLCFYVAIRTTHGLPWQRAMWAAVLTPLILVFIVAAISGLLAVIFGAALSAVLAGGR